MNETSLSIPGIYKIICKKTNKGYIGSFRKKIFIFESDLKNIANKPIDYSLRSTQLSRSRNNYFKNKENREKFAVLSGGRPFVVLKNGKIIDKFICQSLCCKKYGFNQSSLIAHLKGRRTKPYHKVYTFKYL